MTALVRPAKKTLAVLLTAAMLAPAQLFAVEVSAAPTSVSGPAPVFSAGQVTIPSLSAPQVPTAIQGPALINFSVPSAAQASLEPTPILGGAQATLAQPQAVEANPVIQVLNQFQAAGVSLTDTPSSPGQAQKLIQTAQALPASSAKQSIVAMAQAIAASPSSGGSAVAAQLSAAYEGGSAAAPASADAPAAAPATGLWRLVPSFLRPSAKKPAQAAQAVDPQTLEVPAAKLRYTAPIEQLPASSREIDPADAGKPIVGQDAALKAMYYGMKMPGQHYNVFVSGPEGSGRETAAREIATALAAQMPTPNDLVAVTNFADRDHPLVLELMPGSAPKLVAAVQKFVTMYQQVLPQALNSKEATAGRKAIHEQVGEIEDQRRADLDAEVAQERLPGGKFGMQLTSESNGNGTMTVRAVPTFAVDGKMTPLTDEQAAALIAKGSFTEAEWTAAREQAKKSGQPFLEKFVEMMQENQALEKQADEKIEAINSQIAQMAAQQLSDVLLSAVSRDRHSTPAHKEYEKRAQQRLAALDAETSKPTIAGKYGFLLRGEPDQPQVVLVKVIDGKVVPAQQAELQELLSSGQVTQQKIMSIVRPFLKKFGEIMEENDADHRAVHAADPLSPEEERAVKYVSMLAGSAAMNYGLFMPSEEEGGNPMASLMKQARPDPKDLFRVGVLRTVAPGQKGAPVVFVKDYSFDAIFGTAEGGKKTMLMPGVGAVKMKEPGGPLLEGGSLAQAGGGFWVANAIDLLRSPGVWPALMRYVRTGEIEIVEQGLLGLASLQGARFHASSKTKIVLVGSPMIRMLLQHYDEEYKLNFPEATTAEFEPNLPTSSESIEGYLQFFRNVIAQSGGLIAQFSRDAMAAILEYSSKIAGSNEKLSAQFGAMHGLMREATEKAREGGRQEVSRADVDAALAARQAASNVYRKRMKELQVNGVFKIQTEGAVVGQINGLAVTGEDSGVAMRITAETMVREPGDPILASLDRQASGELTGPSFNKALGVEETVVRKMIEELGWKKPLPVSFRLSFEQNYGGIDGDSATSTIIYALLSSLSGVPIKQQFANTGSSDQKDWVQAIGGINAKTAGFYDIAKERGLTGSQGVLMPKTNVSDLNLRPDIAEAIKAGKFHIYQIDNIQQGMEVLTGVPWSVIQQKALARLQEYANARKAGEDDSHMRMPRPSSL